MVELPEFDRLTGPSAWNLSDLVERELADPVGMRVGIHRRLAGLSLSRTVPVLAGFGVGRHRTTGCAKPVFNSTRVVVPTRSPLMIPSSDSTTGFGLFAVVDPSTDRFLHAGLYPTRTTAVTEVFPTELERTIPSTKRCSSPVQPRGCVRPSTALDWRICTRRAATATRSTVSPRGKTTDLCVGKHV